MARRGQVPLPGQFVAVASADGFHDVAQVVDAEVFVHFGDLFPQFFPVAFGQAAHDEQVVDTAFGLRVGECEDRVDGLLFGVADESAGVDYDDPGVRFVRVVDDFETVALQLRHQVFRIDEVFRTTERYDVDFTFHSAYLLAKIGKSALYLHVDMKLTECLRTFKTIDYAE